MDGKQNLKIEASLQIGKSASEVYEAIVNPDHMQNYFISESNGRMESGKDLVWKFPEFKSSYPIHVEKLTVNKSIRFRWDFKTKNVGLIVEIRLKELGENQTIITISEKEMNQDEIGLKWLQNNSQGWANFLACLKAYLEFGINLRKGGFDYLRES